MQKIIIFIFFIMNVYGSEIVGEGFIMINPEGIVKTCIGNTVFLEKKTDQKSQVREYAYAYAPFGLNVQLLRREYIRENKKEIKRQSNNLFKFKDELKGKRRILSENTNIQSTQCGSDGKFYFNNVSPGVYVIGTTVNYKSGMAGLITGSFIYKDINITTNRINHIILTDKD